MTLQTLDQLKKLREELPGVMEEVMGLFIADAPAQMRQIEQAYAEANPETLRQTAHYLRSGALALRLEWIAEQAHRLEFLSANDFGDPNSMRLLNNLRTELGAVVTTLQGELDGKA
jgi:HPt (histidine-containing phosphotransfer) domain-containing protein